MSLESTSGANNDSGGQVLFIDLFLLGWFAIVVAVAVATVGGILLCLLLTLMAISSFDAKATENGFAFLVGAVFGLLFPGSTVGAALLWIRRRVMREMIKSADEGLP